MLCRDASLVKDAEAKTHIMPLMCRSWTCDYCRPRRKRQVVREAAAGNATIFITLTVTPKWGANKEERARRLVTGWRAFVQKAKKHYNYKTIPYFVVFEATKNGEPHLHILARVPWIKQKYLAEHMAKWMDAPNVWVEKVTSNEQAAHYMAKYMGKEPGKFSTCKRYWQTRDYQQEDTEPVTKEEYKELGWNVVYQTVDFMVTTAKKKGHTVTTEGDLTTIHYAEPP